MILHLDARLKAKDAFDELEPEKEGTNQEFEVDNSKIKELISGLEDVLKIEQPKVPSVGHFPPYWQQHYSAQDIRRPEDYFYKKSIELIPKRINAHDIKGFLIACKNYEDKIFSRSQEENPHRKFGAYLASLINHCEDTEMVLPVRHLKSRLDLIGYRNEGRKIVVNGLVGHYAGQEMNSGEIEIRGGVCDFLGYKMKGGKITVLTNANSRTGQQLEGGEIYVLGSTGERAGEDMKDGLIYIEKGEFKSDPFIRELFGLSTPRKRNIGQEEYAPGMGHFMSGGLLCFASNVYSPVGKKMSGGEIRVDGNVDAIRTGSGMSGGKIYIAGDVRGSIGNDMSGGEIKIDGKYFPIAKTIRGGDIYHKGKPIVLGGKKVI